MVVTQVEFWLVGQFEVNILLWSWCVCAMVWPADARGRVDVSAPPGPRQGVMRSVGAGSGDWADCLRSYLKGTVRGVGGLEEFSQAGAILSGG